MGPTGLLTGSEAMRADRAGNVPGPVGVTGSIREVATQAKSSSHPRPMGTYSSVSISTTTLPVWPSAVVRATTNTTGSLSLGFSDWCG